VVKHKTLRIERDKAQFKDAALTQLAIKATMKAEYLDELLVHPALREKARKLSRFIFWKFNKSAGYRSPEDLEHDLYERVLRNIKTFRGESTFETWLSRIAYNIELDELRKRSGTEGYEDLGAEVPKSETITGDTHQVAVLSEALDALPPQLRCIVAAKLAGYTLEEIGQQVGLGKSQVHRKLVQATKQLYAYFKETKINPTGEG
jgi:RNA polymerase sigma factor (sigma-70 family)